MKNMIRNSLSRTVLVAGFLLQSLCLTALSFGAEAQPPLSPEETFRLGERMYREGILPSGAPMQAFVKGDLPVDGTAFTCVSCHLRSGLGSVEGGVVTPPTNGKILFNPIENLYKGVQPSTKYYPVPPHRPAYTDETLATALEGGVEPNGYVMNEVMPRYSLGKADMAIMISYLKRLSVDFSPGVTESAIRFATIITDDVPKADRDAMLAPLENLVRLKNNQAKAYENPRNAKSRLMAEGMLASKELAVRRIILDRWELKGPPESWRSQLEEYNRKEPVFALLGGITGKDWTPVHRFCEENRIPCLFPNTDFPVISETDWYTLYVSKGYFQEGESAARYLLEREELQKKGAVLQIVRESREGKTLAEGFLKAWREAGRPDPVTVKLPAGKPLTKALIGKALGKKSAAAVILWDGAAAVAALELLAGEKKKPAMVMVSSSYLGKGFTSLPAKVRSFTYLTYPHRLPQEKFKPTMETAGIPVTGSRISQHSHYIVQLLNMALMDMKGNYYRDNFLDVIGMIKDMEVPLYLRLSFGPGQRYASKGCYIVQLSPGDKPELVKKGDWVIH